MKAILTISFFIGLSFSSIAQKLDSVRFENLYGRITDIYSKTIDPYLTKMAEQELSPLTANPSNEVMVVRQATVVTKVKTYKTILKEIFSDCYLNLNKNLTPLQEDPHSYVTGYLDMAIRSNFPKLEESFYRENWRELFKIYEIKP